MLQEAYALKLRAHLTYVACARKARLDKRRNAARLFTALVASEAVHARSFKAALKELGLEPVRVAWPDVPARDTSENLEAAAAAESAAVAKDIPALIARARPEGLDAALMNLAQALESDKRHLSLLREAGGFSGRLAELFSGILERARLRLAVCDNCGYIAATRPAVRCPACNGPASAYHDPVTF